MSADQVRMNKDRSSVSQHSESLQYSSSGDKDIDIEIDANTKAENAYWNEYSCMACGTTPATGSNGFGVLFGRNGLLTWALDKISPPKLFSSENKTDSSEGYPSPLYLSRDRNEWKTTGPLEIEYRKDIELLESGEGYGIFGTVSNYLGVSKALVALSVIIMVMFLGWSALSHHEYS